jgi:hypothetical protein
LALTALEDFMKSHHGSTQKLARIRLVSRTRSAFEQAREAMHRGNPLAAARALTRFTTLNRALALLALQA